MAEPSDKQMSFWDHLEVLRWSILRSGIVFFVVLVGMFIALPYIFDDFILGATSGDFFLYRWLGKLMGGNRAAEWLTATDFQVEIISIHVTTQFMTHISCAASLALIVTFPYLMYETWRFIAPALYPGEKKNVSFAFVLGTGMFFLGCAVGYTVIFPFTLRFLTQYTIGTGIVNQISLDSYMHTFTMLILVMGIVFEMPLLVWLLSRLGILSKATLKKYRRHAIVALLILAAAITPTGDPFTLMVMFIPLYLLYEFGILLAVK